MANSELMPAIKLFEQKYDEAERKANAILMTLNMMREEAGLPPHKPGGGGGGGEPATDTEIKADTFFGKKQQTAVREYLEMRKASGGDGPATPREIYEALIAGGYQSQAKDAETALVGLRALLRKRSNVFVKVGNGKYGLLAWYPEMKAQKAAGASAKSAHADDDDDDDDDELPSAQENAADAEASAA